MRSRKKELESIVEVLSQEHDSVEDLAEQIWKMVDQMRKDREGYVVVVNHGHPLYLAYGMFDTVNAATKDLGKFRSLTGGEKAYVVKMVSPSGMFEQKFEDFK